MVCDKDYSTHQISQELWGLEVKSLILASFTQSGVILHVPISQK